MARILITRHGQTKENVEGIIQGNERGSINDKGIEQIADLIRRLKREHIHSIISSDVSRAKLTTEGILESIKVSVEFTPLLREKNNGSWIGKNHGEVNWESLEGSFESRKTLGGENLIEVRERTRRFFKNIFKKYENSDETILVVSHGAFLKVLIGDLLGMSLYDSIFKLHIEHCSLTELVIDKNLKEGYRFNFINDVSHLE